MSYLRNIFKKTIVYEIKCETIVKKPKKGEIMLLNFPQGITQEEIKMVTLKFNKALVQGKGAMGFSGFDIIFLKGGMKPK